MPAVLSIHPTTLLCTAVLGVLLFGLGIAVSGVRGKSNILIGTAPDPDHLLNRLVRAHGNTAEHAPFLALLFLAHGARQPSTLVLGLVLAATAARVVFVAGLLSARTLHKPSPLRFVGALFTYISGVMLAVLLAAG